MNVRPADVDDRTAIREIAQQSFRASYSLSPRQIEAIVGGVFSDDALADRIDDPAVAILVAEDEASALGFVDVEIGDGGTLRWLHVDPDARGGGVGTALVEQVRADLTATERPLTARVLEEASEGDTFLERFGLQQTDSVQVEFAGERFYEHVYTAEERPRDETGSTVEIPESVSVDGDEHPVDRYEPIPGTEASFFSIYVDDVGGQRYGFFCSNCASTDVSADGLERLECGNCGNRHLADEWDDAYL